MSAVDDIVWYSYIRAREKATEALYTLQEYRLSLLGLSELHEDGEREYLAGKVTSLGQAMSKLEVEFMTTIVKDRR